MQWVFGGVFIRRVTDSLQLPITPRHCGIAVNLDVSNEEFF